MKTRKKIKSPIHYFKFLILLLAGLAAFACGKSKHDEKVIHPATASVMAVHASADALPSNFYLGGTKLSNTPLSYGDHTNYVAAPSGIKKAEFKNSANDNVLASTDVTLTDKKSYTVFLAGPVANAEVLTLEDDLTAPVAGKARVRFVNLSADNVLWDIQLAGGDKLATQRAYKSATTFMDVAPGDLTYQLVNPADAEHPITLPVLTVQVGKIYTIWIKGSRNGVGSAALSATIIEHNR